MWNRGKKLWRYITPINVLGALAIIVNFRKYRLTSAIRRHKYIHFAGQSKLIKKTMR